MEALCKIERWHDFLASTCRLERVLSHWGGWVHSCTRDSRWTCFHMVGTICIGQAQTNCHCCQQWYQMNTQMWDWDS
jgi:hypothetical protein